MNTEHEQIAREAAAQLIPQSDKIREVAESVILSAIKRATEQVDETWRERFRKFEKVEEKFGPQQEWTVKTVRKLAATGTQLSTSYAAIRDAHNAALDAERQRDMCDACDGTGNTVSGKPCMCNGTGRMADAAMTLRKELFDTETQLLSAQAALHELQDERVKDKNLPKV